MGQAKYDTAFPFFGLPAELREKIYCDLLVRQRILISYNQTLPSRCERERRTIPKGLVAVAESSPHLERSSHNGRASTTFELSEPYASSTTISILLACRRTYLEASYMLYAQNTFDFTTLPSVRPFLDLIGPHNRARLNCVRLSSWNRLGLESALEALRELSPGLKQIQIGVFKFDTYQGQWHGFLNEVDKLGQEMTGKLKFFAGGGDSWEAGRGCVVASRDVEVEGMKESRSVSKGECNPSSYISDSGLWYSTSTHPL